MSTASRRMTTETDFPKCHDCHQPIGHFDQYFSEDCPARTMLPPARGGHQLTTEEWTALPFGPPKEQGPQP